MDNQAAFKMRDIFVGVCEKWLSTNSSPSSFEPPVITRIRNTADKICKDMPSMKDANSIAKFLRNLWRAEDVKRILIYTLGERAQDLDAQHLEFFSAKVLLDILMERELGAIELGTDPLVAGIKMLVGHGEVTDVIDEQSDLILQQLEWRFEQNDPDALSARDILLKNFQFGQLRMGIAEDRRVDDYSISLWRFLGEVKRNYPRVFNVLEDFIASERSHSEFNLVLRQIVADTGEDFGNPSQYLH